MTDQSQPTRQSLLDRWFLAHPATVDETYFQHMRFAAGFAFWLMTAGFAALVHAVFPALCETTASRILRKLTDRMNARH
ncbi:DUF6356 family protein [Octadecabacter sp. G9-8]|uniref:DUF6356 family protein n=1 Tax=Octadecabacter dasysiphoniae TaxID=2909341 RepID=A0ABS9CVE2_9RHOB|nr:DUF6356 family protein [Octadecabacter dasysiphoniae]MCF2871204.1 DUF6356 family protein [Octadecabacter dasysiphoniae]